MAENLDGRLIRMGFVLLPESIIKRSKSHKDSFETDGRSLLGDGCKGMKLILEPGGKATPLPSPELMLRAGSLWEAGLKGMGPAWKLWRNVPCLQMLTWTHA